MENIPGYDEERELPSPWEWVIVSIFSLSIVAFGATVYRLVDDGPRHWDVGQMADTPAESVLSTETPPMRVVVPLQVHPLPEARPINGPQKNPREQLRERGGQP